MVKEILLDTGVITLYFLKDTTENSAIIRSNQKPTGHCIYNISNSHRNI